MKTVWILLFAFILTGCSSGSDQPETTEQTETEMSGEMEISPTDEPEEEVLSPPREASGTIGNVSILVDYSAPSVREREIWGELVPYNEIWVTGAHMATFVEFDNDILVNGEPVSAGRYAFFTIPGENNWTIILNENWDQHQAGEYDSELDVARFEVQPESNTHTEQLNYTVVTGDENSGHIEMAWEELKIRVPVSTL